MTRSHCERPASVNRRTLIFCGQSNGHSGACCGRKTLGADRHPLKSLPKRFELDLHQWLTMTLAHVRFNARNTVFFVISLVWLVFLIAAALYLIIR
ncbi:hypothetical protein [Bradyrhizobium sp. CCBAU 051011]|jgi:hypothetical protein|uniref:hypothetical protein n=1 Tax=Bradyrhizobium sp. CCBAU 051011 TaxID=858422 RepID=UPI001AED844B|nr:hypothetical protein [Bradyrhizobium sp. CCBAU 051011]